MPIAFGERQHPIWDALRVQTLQGLPTGDQASGASAILGLGNKIILYHADGSDLQLFDPTEAGLNAALTAFTGNDTAWLPSIPIACTAAITIPAGGAVVGVSHKSVLSFSGFAGAAVVLSADSIIQDFTLNHSDGKWFDASADGSKALRIHGTAQRAIIGVSVPAEPWFATTAVGGGDIFWLDRAINGWHKITPGIGVIDNFYIRADGSMAFLYIFADGWYKGTSLKTSPSWTKIASDTGANVLRHGSCDGTNFYMVEIVDYPSRTWKHGTYNGTSWSYGSNYIKNWFSPDCTAKDFACYFGTVIDSGGAIIEDALIDYRNGHDGWVASGGLRYAFGKDVSNNHLVLRRPAVSTYLDTGLTHDAQHTFVRGAIGGAHIYAVDSNGVLHYSSNGTAFSSVATWEPGIANDTLQSGGGDLVWVREEFTTGDAPARLYTVGSWGSVDLTYNFWSLTTGDQAVIGMGMVYP